MSHGSRNTIAHIDADHFYANCELARRPELRGKPVMVLGKLGSCILAKTPEAKKAGVTTAMPLWEAKKLVPSVPVSKDGSFLRSARAGEGYYLQGDFRYYTLVSRQLMDLLGEWSPAMEVYSVDEAFLDLEGLRGLHKKTYAGIGDQIRREARDRIGITVSVGVSVNKTLAKMACELNKPDGTTVVNWRDITSFLEQIPVGDIPGVGGSRGALLEKYSIRTAAQFAALPQSTIQGWFGKTGHLLWRELRGETSFPLQTEPPPPKTIARTSSFDKPTPDRKAVRGLAIYHLERAIEALCRHNLLVGEVILHLRDREFHVYGLPYRFEKPTRDFFELVGALAELLERIPRNRVWRSAGACLTRLTPNTGRQLDLFADIDRLNRIEELNKARLRLNERFGRTTVRSGTTLFINEKCARSGWRLGLPLTKIG
jgi:DNA polymerase-4/DNA polymerase V